jgi:hypothetical protein
MKASETPFAHPFDRLATYENGRTPVLLLEAEYKRAKQCWEAHDELIGALRDLDKRLRACFGDPITAQEAYDSFYQDIVASAIAKASPHSPHSQD